MVSFPYVSSFQPVNTHKHPHVHCNKIFYPLSTSVCSNLTRNVQLLASSVIIISPVIGTKACPCYASQTGIEIDLPSRPFATSPWKCENMFSLRYSNNCKYRLVILLISTKSMQHRWEKNGTTMLRHDNNRQPVVVMIITADLLLLCLNNWSLGSLQSNHMCYHGCVLRFHCRHFIGQSFNLSTSAISPSVLPDNS